MVDHYNKQGRETIPGMLEISYNELKDELEECGILDEVPLDDSSYNGTDLLVDVEFMGYHEDGTHGDLNLLIYPENDPAMETITLNRVERVDVKSLLDGREIKEQAAVSLTPETEAKGSRTAGSD